MKLRNLLWAICLIMLFSFNTKVNAASACTYQEEVELLQKAGNVRINYEPVDEVYDEGGEGPYIETYFKITILNVTDDLYVVLKNDKGDEDQIFYASDAVDGVITYKYYKFQEITNFTLEVYSSMDTPCPNEVYKTLYMATPRYNRYYNRKICVDNPDFYLCKEYVTVPEFTEDDFLEKLDAYLKGQIGNEGEPIPEENPTILENVVNFVKKYRWPILGVLVVVGGSLTGVIIYKKKKQKEMGL